MGMERVKINETPRPRPRHHQLEQSLTRRLTYETRGWKLVVKELSDFCRGVIRNTFTLEFLTIAVPILILWELLPRLNLVPQSLVPTPSVVALTFWDLLANHNFLGHTGISLLRYNGQRNSDKK